MHIHQAYFGEVQKSHSQIASTIDDSSLKSFLLSFTDRPGSIPPGIDLQPYYSGSSFSQYFIFTKTFHDNSVREGMVFTHALILNLSDAIEINDLTGIFDKFVTNIPKERKLEIIIKATETPSELPEMVPLYFKEVAQNILSSNFPVIFSGSSNEFLELIKTIWRGMFKNVRKQFKYRISFTPYDLDGINDLMLVNVHSSAAKWSDHNVIDSQTNTLVKPESNAEKLILGYKENNLFHDFISDLGISIDKLDILSICDTAFTYFQSIDKSITQQEVRQLVRMIIKLSPDPKNGNEIKQKSLRTLTQLSLNATEGDILALRNLDLVPVKGGEKIVSDLLSEFVSKRFQDAVNVSYSSFSELIELAHSNDGQTWWRTVIRNTLKAIVGSPTKNTYKTIWGLLSNGSRILKILDIYIPENESAENILMITIPKSVSKELAVALLQFTDSRKWYLFHSEILFASNDITQAFKKQLTFEEGLDLTASLGTRSLMQKISDIDFIKIALELDNSKLLQLAGEKCVDKNSLLDKLDVSKKGWLDIWAYSLNISEDLSKGVKNLDKVIEGIFNSMLNNLAIPDTILNLISQSKYVDINKHKMRTELWSKLPHKYRDIFLTSTAKTLAIIISLGKSKKITLEKELIAKMTSDSFVDDFLNRNKSFAQGVINFYAFFSSLPDKKLADFIRNIPVNITRIDSVSLGNLINERNYQSSANAIYSKAKFNPTFKPCFTKCKRLVNPPFWEVFIYHNLIDSSEISETDAFRALTELAVELYPQGPEDNDIWKRSGGDVAKLTNHRTREENWRTAIALLNKGGGGKKINPIALLKQMKEDFNNNKVEALLNYFKN